MQSLNYNLISIGDEYYLLKAISPCGVFSTEVEQFKMYPQIRAKWSAYHYNM